MATQMQQPMAQMKPPPEPSSGIWKYMLAGTIASALLVFGAGGWAHTTNISGAVIATGVVTVESSIKKVQHSSGGVIGKIAVKEGEHVKAGDLLIKLDETVTRANLQIITKQLDELASRKARLRAERDGASEIDIPETLLERRDDPEINELLAGEAMLFTSRRKAVAGQKAQLRNRMQQSREEIGGLEAQQKAKAAEIELIQNDLADLEPEYKKGNVVRAKITAMKREATRLEGERARLVAGAAQARGKIAETQLQILQIDSEMRAEVIKELRDIQAQEAQLQERRIAADDQLNKIEIRAPQTGIVHQLAVHTVGGYVNRGETLMTIVPASDNLVIQAKVASEDRANIHLNQLTYVLFTAFNQRTTPEFIGKVDRIGADLTIDERMNLTYYSVRITLSKEELQRLGDLKLIPGMPVEIHIKTSDRTAWSYLMRPLLDQMRRAFTED